MSACGAARFDAVSIVGQPIVGNDEIGRAVTSTRLKAPTSRMRRGSERCARRSISRFLLSSSAATGPPNACGRRARTVTMLHKPVRPRALRAMLGQFLKQHDHDLADVAL